MEELKTPKSSVWDFFGAKLDERGKAAAVQTYSSSKGVKHD